MATSAETNRGFRETQASYGFAETQVCIGDVRRFGPYGPAYEVIDITANGDLRIAVIETGECLDVLGAHALGQKVLAAVDCDDL